MHIEEEVKMYESVTLYIQKELKINNLIWDNTIESHMPGGDKMSKDIILFSLISPFKCTDEEKCMKQKILDLYIEGCQFSLD